MADKYRYFGLNSPSGAYWYNFDPLTYLECGIRGTWGGYLDDEVIVLIPRPAAEAIEDRFYNLETFTWADFIAILECGQWYE